MWYQILIMLITLIEVISPLKNSTVDLKILLASTTETPTTNHNSDGDNTIDGNHPFFTNLTTACILVKIPPINCTCTVVNNLMEFGKTHPLCDASNPKTEQSNMSLGTTFICVITSAKLANTITILTISVIGIIGNALVLIVRVHNWRKSLHYQLISGLAISDLSFSIMHMITKIPDIWSCRWIYGLVFCKLFKYLLILSSSLEVGFILIIAIERYIGIVHPFTGGASACKIYLMIGTNLVLSFAISLPLLFVYHLDNGSYFSLCREDWSQFEDGSLIFNWCTNVIFFFLPIMATAFLYYQSLKTLKSTLFRQEMLVTLDEHSRKKLVSENKRILRIISIILVAFLSLVGPNHIAWLIVDNSEISHYTRKILFIISGIAYALHATVNPIIYSIIDRKFRKNVLYLIRYRQRKKSYHTIVMALNCTPVHQMNNIELQSPLTVSENSCE